MNTISKINNVKNLQPANLKAGEPAASNGLYLQQQPQYDAFAPSFQANPNNMKNAAKPMADGLMTKLMQPVKYAKDNFKKLGLLGLTGLMAISQTGCLKVNIKNETKIKFDDTYLQLMYEELQELAEQNADLKTILLRIEALIQYQNQLTYENQQLLAQLMQLAIQSNEINTQNHEELVELINKLLDQIYAVNGNLHQMTQQQAMAFQRLISILLHMQHGQDQMIGFMSQLLDMANDIKELICVVINHMENFEANQIAGLQQLAQIYQEIQQGNINLQAIQELIEQLKHECNMNAQAILAALQGMMIQINNQLNQVNNNLQMLHMDLRDLKDIITNMAHEIEEQMNNILQNQVNGQAIIAEWLQAIWEKIPQALGNCNCEECCQQIIEILMQIIELIQNGDWNHEGIDNQLDPLLGKAMRTWSQVIDEIGKGDNADSAKIEKLINEAKDIVKQIKSKPAQNPTFADILNS